MAQSVVRGRPSTDWETLFRQTRIDGALDEVGHALDRAGSCDLEITTASSPASTIALVHARVSGSVRSEKSSWIGGDPAWTLTARARAGASPSLHAMAEASSALAAWRVARAEVCRIDAGLEARTLELALLQAIGRSAAEARSHDELFAGAAAVLHAGGVIDLLAAVLSAQEQPTALVFLGRPVPAHDIEALIGETIPLRIVPLDGFDTERGVREGVRADAVVHVPLERRSAPAARLILLVSAPVDEAKVRLVYGAANQISVHLDRILTVREAEEGRFRSMLESMPQAVLRTDRSLRVVHANAAAVALLDRIGSGASGAGLARIGALDTMELIADVLAGTTASVAAETRTADGSVLDVTVSALADGAVRPEGLVFVLADVTERRRLQSQLAQAEKLSSLGQMISGIAHELNNPLTAVVGFAQLAHTTAGDERLVRRLDTIHREALRCQKIVQNLLAFARRHEPTRTTLALNDVAEAVLALLDYQLRVGGVRVERALDSGLPAIQGDPHELQQALLNLVTNAHHSMASRGGGTVVVRTAPAAAGWVAIEVEDDGPGVPEGIRSRIFDPFFTTKADGKGTGLGLSIVYGIVSAHGGTIRVEDPPAGGARFRIELPIGLRVTLRDAVPELDASTTQLRPGRILVVDDEEPVARLICEALAEDGHETVSAFNGREALDRMASEPFDLIISDLRMPGLAAERMCEEMDLLEHGLSRRLLLTTGDTVSREADAIAERAGLSILHKPFDLHHLRRTVRSRLATHAGRDCAS